MAGLARLAEDPANLDIKAMVGSAGWLRLRIGNYRVCYLPVTGNTGDGKPTVIYVVERIVHRRDLDAAAASLPAPDES